ncbi:MAG: hypothetical protein MMC33_000266 [Icmadophila ericetorum]|nr:hypothetical protein [Icmadophila ericetorum]
MGWNPLGERGDKPPALLELRSSKIFIVTAVCIGVFTDIFLYAVIVPVIPFALTTRVGIKSPDVQHWVSVLLAVYGAALLVASPICGWLADKSPNRRLPLLIGLFALGGATVMLCVGTSIGVLVTGRLLQGFSAAIIWTVGLALLVDTVGQQGIGQAIGYVGLTLSIAVLIAPLLGGVVYARAGYYAVFYMTFSLIIVDIILRVTLIEKKVAKKWIPDSPPPTSYGGTTMVTPGQPPILEIPSNLVEKPLSTPEKRTRLPPVFTLLASRRLLSALWGCMVQAALATAFDSVLPLRVHALWGWSSLGSGLLFLAFVLPSFVSPLVGKGSDKFGPRWFTTAGFWLACPTLVLLRFVDHDSLGQKVLLCALLAFLGLSLSLALTPLMAEIAYVVEAKEKKSPGAFGSKGAYAQAYGLFNTAYAGGTLIGPIWGGFVSLRAGWDTMAWSLGVLCVLTAIPSAIYTGGMITRRNDQNSRWGTHDEKNSVVTAE